jgi:hypothetical protein
MYSSQNNILTVDRQGDGRSHNALLVQSPVLVTADLALPQTLCKQSPAAVEGLTRGKLALVVTGKVFSNDLVVPIVCDAIVLTKTALLCEAP